LDPLAGRMWPAGRVFETPALEENSNGQRRMFKRLAGEKSSYSCIVS